MAISQTVSPVVNHRGVIPFIPLSELNAAVQLLL